MNLLPPVVAFMLTAGSLTVTAAESQRFVPVQPEQFAVPGSLAVAWADFDGDGDLDFAASTAAGAVLLYRNDDGLFTDVTDTARLPRSGDEIRGLAWGDFDGDGDPDLFAGSNVDPIPSRSYAYRNDGGVFTEVAPQLGLETPGHFSRQANWVDVDGDGTLDLYATNRFGFNRLYRNANGSFEAVPASNGGSDPRRTVGACWADLDRDGDLDLFLANQSGDTDALWRNDGDMRFTDIAPALGLHQSNRPVSDGGVGCAIGDYNNDGHFDIFVAAYGNNALYRNNGEGTFSDVAQELGLMEPRYAVGAAWADFDNDGRLDLMVVGYHRVERTAVPHTILYRNDGVRFNDVSATFPEINVGDHAIEWIDFNADGAIDFSLTKGYGSEGGHFLFRNALNEAARLRGLNVLPLDARGVLQPGTEVRAYFAGGALVGSRLVNTGGGYNSQSAAPVHFGLPSPGPITVEVTFLAGSQRIVETFGEVYPERLNGKPLTVRQSKAD
jgi:hypothetical protein